MKKAYDQGTLMMLGETVARIGCAAAMPKDHKNEWLQNRFSLKPAGRMRIPGMKGTHLVWRETDAEKARQIWLAAQPQGTADRVPAAGHPPRRYPDQITVQLSGSPPRDILEEVKAIEAEQPGWKKIPAGGKDLALSLIDLAGQLLKQAHVLLGVPA